MAVDRITGFRPVKGHHSHLHAPISIATFVFRATI